MQAVILAGGLATRMRPLTLTLPKSLVPVAGKPFIAWQLERIAASGIERVVLCIGHLGQRIRALVGDGAAFSLQVDYSEDGPELLGTAGALRQALPLLEDTFLATYGDSYLPFDYSEPLADLNGHPEALGTMSVFCNQGQWEPSNCQVQGQRVVRYEKGGQEPELDHIDYGATALRRVVVQELAPGAKLGLDRLQAQLSQALKLRAWVAQERFYEIGSEPGLRALEQKLRGQP